ncbi:PKD domain-containing protein [Methanosarcina sp.]|uniref:PKD domain-containing protein n=1 Tax=Methanosarcina sp. TaxID=2213 RepID=UPI002988A75C|nr:PKD domain-containing protein [Methanosarcina sp.]MDW5549944.1 PKD domain-containing protein [Methanosarcina sp.]MDW5552548.1 PKD domain-containing protein [Methanosarcina sp.]MDW5560979.1 PKD domain-containing protein [Methanosarcina sp.]
MKINRKLYSVALASAALILFLILVSSAASAANAQSASPAKTYAYITNFDDDTISVIDTATNKVTATVPVWGSEAWGVAVSPDGKKVYVTCFSDVYSIDTATNTATHMVSLGSTLRGVAVSPDGKKVYVTNINDGTVSVIDTATNKVTATVNVGSTLRGVAVTPDGSKVYVANSGDNNISVIDTATNKVTATVNVGSWPYGVAINFMGTKVYVTNTDSNTVSVIDTTTNKVIATVPVGSDPLGVAVNPDETKVYVANNGNDDDPENTVSVIDTATNKVIATVSVGSDPFGVSVTPDGKKVYVANSDDGTVSVIDTATNKVIATVDAGWGPVALGQFIVPASVKPGFPVANFTSNVTKGYVPLKVRFTDLSENATSRNWNFGDGTNSTVKSPTHTYLASGNYTVNLTAINAKGTGSKLGTITVFDTSVLPPVANFSSNVTNGYTPLCVQFTDLSKNATEWNWDFGDGDTSSEQNPTHTYYAEGNYNVTLRVINPVGESTKTSKMKVKISSNAGTYAYVANACDDTVSIIDITANKVTGVMPVGSYPFGIAVTPDGKKVYVTNIGSNTTSVINTETNKVTATIKELYEPIGIAVSPDGKKAYVMSDGYTVENDTGWYFIGGNVSVIDTATNKVTAKMDTGGNPSKMTITLDGKKLYITHGFDFYGDGENVGIYDTATMTSTTWFRVTGMPSGVAVSPDGKKAYVASRVTENPGNPTQKKYRGIVSVVDTVTNKVTAKVTIIEPTIENVQLDGVLVSLDGKKVYVTNSWGDNTYVIDTVTNKVIATVKGNYPNGIAFSPDGRKVYVANSGDDNVCVIDTATNKVTATVAVGSCPEGVAISPIKQVSPVSNFTSNVTSGKAPLTVAFTDKSTGIPTKWKWIFGDGANSTKQNPIHKYSKAGNYTVSLTVSNSAGNNTTTKTNYIKVTAATTKPVANFTSNVTSGKVPLTVAFTDKSKGDPTKWKWIFGDGTNSTSKNPIHKYSKAGNYTVSLTVSNAAGSNTLTKSNYIKVTTIIKPVAAFSASPASGKVPLKVTFSDKSTNSPTSWKWSFGDGKTSTVKNPVHTYSKAGNYTVSLTVKNTAGTSTKTIKNYVTVKTAPIKPVASFSASPTSGKAPLKVSFTDQSAGTPTKWGWSFGDGTTSNKQNPVHTYSKAGTYTVKLTVTNAAGTNTVTKAGYIQVVAKPVAAFSASPTSGKAPLKVTFTDKSTNSPASWKWSFGDGKTSTVKNPVHTYSKTGKYTVSLTVKNAAGSSTKTVSGYIKVSTK